MNKTRKQISTFIVQLALLLSIFISLRMSESYQAASSYTNAKEFYISTSSDTKNYHAEMINGSIYYATSAKLAVSSTNTRYRTIGFDIQLTGNNQTISFTVQRTGGSMTEIDSRKDSTHEYILYVIDDKTLFDLAHAADSTKATQILSASIISIKMDAILTTITSSSVGGGITENGSGGFTSWGNIYRLNNNDDLSELKTIFIGHEFKSYKNIKEYLYNHQLSLRYNMQGLDSTSSTSASVGNGYSILNEFLASNNTVYIQTQRVLQQMTLINPSSINLKKEGYHLPKGKEWMTKDKRIFNSKNTYMPQNIEPLVGSQDNQITMYANWIPNTYTVTYHANGGTGSVLPSDFVFDKSQNLQENTFTKPGYRLKKDAEWNTKKNGSGKSYSSKQLVSNLASKDGDTITLYANWEPIVVPITLDKQGGTGGHNTLFEKYTKEFYLDKNCTSILSTISLPEQKGHTCRGYFTELSGSGNIIVDSTGKILVDNTYFTEPTTIYACYTPNLYTITFDKQGGQSDIGTSSTTATYGEYFPKATAPVRKGYSFKGYFTQVQGQGTQYYNEHMACDDKYLFTTNLTLFSYWVDDILPTVTLTADYGTGGNWTKNAITLTATAMDEGDGLSSFVLYRLDEKQTETAVINSSALNGAKNKTLTYQNPTEGVVRYKAVATDTKNRQAIAWLTIYYDITAPSIRLNNSNTNPTALFFNTDISDIKTH